MYALVFCRKGENIFSASTLHLSCKIITVIVTCV